MMGRAKIPGGRRTAAVMLAALALGACTKGTPAVYYPNVTHVNGVPVEEYKPKKSDRRKDIVLTVATPTSGAVAQPSTVTAQSAPTTNAATPATPSTSATTAAVSTTASVASTATSAATTAASAATTATTTSATAATTAASGTSAAASALVPIAGVITPAVIAASQLGPESGYLSAVTLVDGDKVEVAVVDADTATRIGLRESDVTAAGATAVRVTGPNLSTDQSLRAYANVCKVRYEDMVRWSQQGGRIAQLQRPQGYVFYISVCPGLMQYVQAGR